MIGVDPGPGWREVPVSEVNNLELVQYNERAIPIRRWVPAVSDPPQVLLPTAPHTVIRVSWADEVTRAEGGESELLVLDSMGYWNVAGVEYAWLHQNLSTAITSLEVLSEPRAITAKAVLDRINKYPLPLSVQPVLITVADEYGVTE